MGESNGEWGQLETDETRDAWDSFEHLPAPGVSPALDSFVARKRITIDDLVRVGARLSGPTVLAFGFPGGLKFRNIVNDDRWNYTGSEFTSLKIVSSRASLGESSSTVLVVEGETDAARLSSVFDSDVAILPVGALGWKPSFAEQLQPYKRILLALDADKAGDAGSERIRKALGRGERFRPPASDWCAVDGPLPPLPAVAAGPTSILVPAGELLELEAPDQPSYFDNAILPIGGTLILHGPYKSYKSWIALDLLAALAQAESWALFEARQEPERVAVLNFEIPWAYYKERIMQMRRYATRPQEFDKNLLTYSPLVRPRLVAGDSASESVILRELVGGDVSVVLLDPVRRAIGLSDPNAEHEVRRMLHFVERLNDEGIAVVMVHHDNKEGDKYGGGDPRYMTGSGAWAGDVDGIVSITLPHGEARDTGTRRNLRFLLRNAPSPGARGFEFNGRGAEYTHEAFIETEAGDAPF